MHFDEASGTVSSSRAASVVSGIEQRSCAQILVIVVISWAAIFVIDVVTGPEISASVFYLLPIALVALRFGLRPACVAAVAAAVTWYVADRLADGGAFGTGVTIWNGVVRLGFFGIVAFSLDAIRSLLREQRHTATVDLLTGVLNVRGFRQRAESELSRAQRTGQPFSLAYIDLDHFKQLNDSRGHSTGDAALREIATALAGSIRLVDVLGRLGGDEFAIVFPESDEAEAAAAIVRCRAALCDVQAEYRLGTSIGVVTFLHPVASVDEALRIADRVMYDVKAEGRGTVHHVTEPPTFPVAS